MSWLLLVVAGLLEVGWATTLPHAQGLSRPVPTVLFLALLGASMVALAKATETIPIGVGYGVWVGIGAVGAAVVGMVAGGEPVSPARLAFLVLLVVAIGGLKLTSGH